MNQASHAATHCKPKARSALAALFVFAVGVLITAGLLLLWLPEVTMVVSTLACLALAFCVVLILDTVMDSPACAEPGHTVRHLADDRGFFR